MALEGVVTNVTAFGAFVDIGVHQDGLVHVSELADRFVKDPREVVKAGDVVKVRVKEVDVERKRIALTMKSGAIDARPTGEMRGPGAGGRTSLQAAAARRTTSATPPPLRPRMPRRRNRLWPPRCAARRRRSRDLSEVRPGGLLSGRGTTLRCRIRLPATRPWQQCRWRARAIRVVAVRRIVPSVRRIHGPLINGTDIHARLPCRDDGLIRRLMIVDDFLDTTACRADRLVHLAGKFRQQHLPRRRLLVLPSYMSTAMTAGRTPLSP